MAIDLFTNHVYLVYKSNLFVKSKQFTRYCHKTYIAFQLKTLKLNLRQITITIGPWQQFVTHLFYDGKLENMQGTNWYW